MDLIGLLGFWNACSCPFGRLLSLWIYYSLPNVPYLISIVPMCPSHVFLKLIPCILPKLISYLLPWVLMSPPCRSPPLHSEFFVQSQYSSHLYIVRPKGVPQTQLNDWLEDFKSTAHHKCRNGQ
jgi:hypothetical protein